MKKTIDYGNLYVAYPVYDHHEETEMYEQYSTMGVIKHHILVSPKKVLVVSKVDEDGNIKYYNYKTGEEVKEYSYETSFETTSSPLESLYCCYVNGIFALPFKDMRESFNKKHAELRKRVGYFIPFSQYMEERFGVSMSSITPAMASKILRLLNIGVGDEFELSSDSEKAKEQLAQLGYHMQTKKKVDL